MPKRVKIQKYKQREKLNESAAHNRLLERRKGGLGGLGPSSDTRPMAAGNATAVPEFNSGKLKAAEKLVAKSSSGSGERI